MGDTRLFSPSWIDTTNYGVNGTRSNSSNSGDGEISHSESVIYTPTKRLTFYFTYGTSYEQGDTAPTTAGITNPVPRSLRTRASSSRSAASTC